MRPGAVLFAAFVVVLAGTACGEDNRSTFEFSPVVVEAWRTPALATECSQFDAPSSDDDTFRIKAVEGKVGKLGRLSIFFKRRTPRGVELDAWQASGSDSPGIWPEYPEGAQTKYVSKASVTVTDVPTKDGEIAGARFEIEWVDGDILEGSISAPVVSEGGPCKTGS